MVTHGISKLEYPVSFICMHSIWWVNVSRTPGFPLFRSDMVRGGLVQVPYLCCLRTPPSLFSSYSRGPDPGLPYWSLHNLGTGWCKTSLCCPRRGVSSGFVCAELQEHCKSTARHWQRSCGTGQRGRPPQEPAGHRLVATDKDGWRGRAGKGVEKERAVNFIFPSWSLFLSSLLEIFLHSPSVHWENMLNPTSNIPKIVKYWEIWMWTWLTTHLGANSGQSKMSG